MREVYTVFGRYIELGCQFSRLTAATQLAYSRVAGKGNPVGQRRKKATIYQLNFDGKNLLQKGKIFVVKCTSRLCMFSTVQWRTVYCSTCSIDGFVVFDDSRFG